MRTTKPSFKSCLSIALFAIELLGCDPHDPENTIKPAAKQSSGGEVNAASAIVQAPPKQAQLELLDRGKEPRTLLVYKLSKDAAKQSQIEIQSAVGLKVRGQAFPLRDLPRAQFMVRTTVTDVAPNGDAKLSSMFEAAKIVDPERYEPEMIKTMTEQMLELKGLQTSMRLSPNGITKDLTVKSQRPISLQTQQLADNLKLSLQDQCAMLPQEEVGVGARWKVTQPLIMGGITMTQEVLYELKARKDDKIELHVQYVQHAQPQALPLMQDTKQAKATLNRLKGGGRAAQNIDLVSLQSELESLVQSELDYTYMNEGKQYAMGMQLRVSVSIHAVNPKK